MDEPQAPILDFDHLRVWNHSDANSELDRLLHDASEVLRRNPGMAVQLHDSTLELRVPVPHGYKPRVQRFASELRARLNQKGLLFELTEVSPYGSGGWLGSCLPACQIQTFLQAWVRHQQCSVQADLFA